MKKKNKIVYSSFDRYLNQELKDPEFRKYYRQYGKQMKIAYQVLQLRKEKRISQGELAKKIGTRQSNIARMESGQQNFTIGMVEKIAHALNCELEINLSVK